MLAATPTDDAAQRVVVELPIEASGVVVGAAGTGKTATLVRRVQALIAGGVSPDELLVLTASRQAATTLRDELGLAVGVATPGPLARSVAAFAFALVRAAAVAAEDDEPQLLTGGDEDQIVHDLLDGDADDEAAGRARWPVWLPAPVRSTAGFRAELRAFLADCTTRGIRPDDLRVAGTARGIEAWGALASFSEDYARVRRQMRGAHRDAATLVREAAEIARHPGVLGADDVLARLRVLLVDDAQEVTRGAVELIEACRDRGISVLAFGDPDVGSGAFRGANPAHFARLAASLGGLWTLGTPHRGRPGQVDLLRRVTERIGAVGVVSHRRPPAAPGETPDDDAVRALVVRSPAEEYDAIARLLRERHLRGGMAWRDLAVIAHDTRQVTALQAELSARDVPTRSLGASLRLAEARPVRDLLDAVDLAIGAPDAPSAERREEFLLGSCGGLDAVGLRRLRMALRHDELARGGTRGSAELIASAVAEPLEFDLIDTREARRAGRAARTLQLIRDQHAAGASAHELLWTAWERSGLEREWATAANGRGAIADRANRDLDAVSALFQAAKRFTERAVLTEAAVFVRATLDSTIAEDRLDAVVADAVRVMTPASSLGTEFDTVVVAGVQDGVWPNTRLRGSLLDTWRLDELETLDAAASSVDRRREALHDELRLFARAVSRSRNHVVITAVDDDDRGPSPLFEMLPTPEPAGPAAEHPLSLRGHVARHRRTLTSLGSGASDPRTHAAGQLALLADAGVPGAAPAQWYGLVETTSTAPLRDADRDSVRVSPSRLHALEECELNWVIGDLGATDGALTAGIGTIVHAALDRASGPSEEDLWREVESRWGELVFEAPWRERAERARTRDLVRRLAIYLRDADRAGTTLIGSEPHFEVPLPVSGASPGARPALLSGFIDRVEVDANGAVVIVDLKTGKTEPQTDAKVVDHPQLAAYQLAFEAGAIPDAAGLRAGGAKLLVLRPTAASKDYVTPWQPPFDDDRRAAFLARLAAAVAVMQGSAFRAPYEEHCRDDHTYGFCRIHTVGAVSAG